MANPQSLFRPAAHLAVCLSFCVAACLSATTGLSQTVSGTGLGLQDTAVTQTLDDTDTASKAESEKVVERYRDTPPVNNPVPKLNPKHSGVKNWTVPGEVKTSWVGNTLGGATGVDGYQNGFGEWVQNGIAPAAFAVAPDGTAVAGVGWDEAGRCIGLYKNGKVNPRIVAQYDMRGGHRAWGFGSANTAVAVDGEFIYAGNRDGQLIRIVRSMALRQRSSG